MKRVYFIKPADMNGPIKIGSSDAPRLRLKQLQADCHIAMDLLAEAPGGPWDERNIQEKFAEHRTVAEFIPTDRGYLCAGPTEWFKPAPELLAFIEIVRDRGAIPFELIVNREAEMVRMRAKGATYAAIGSRFGVTRQFVQQIISKIEAGRSGSIAA
tara:strand:- start:409 stop:879 length:471 start_codon:yes stop_codon:yes gene_type:complete